MAKDGGPLEAARRKRRRVYSLAIAAIAVAALSACRDAQKKARAEIESRGQEWVTARACFLGDAPAADNAHDSLLIRAVEQSEQIGDILRCPLSDALGRDHEVDPESPRIEGGWLDFERIMRELLRYQADPPKVTTREEQDDALDALGRRIERVDRAYNALRERAGMTTDFLPAGPPVPDTPAGITVADARGTPVRPIALALHNNALSIQGDGAVAIVRGPTQIEVIPRGAGVVPAVGGGRWGAWREPRDSDVDDNVLVATGPLDEHGEPKPGATVVARGNGVVPLFALEAGDRRYILINVPMSYRDEYGDGLVTALAVARSDDDGASWNEVLRAGRNGTAFPTFDWAGARVAITWTDDKGAAFGVVLDRSAEAGKIEPTPLPEAHAQPHPCLAQQRVWWISPGALHVQDLGGQEVHAVPGYTHRRGRIVCSDVGLLSFDKSLLACSPQQCTSFGRGTYDRAWKFGLGKRTGYTAVRQWLGYLVANDAARGRSSVRFRAPAGGELFAGVEWNGTLFAVYRFADHVQLLPVGRP